MRLILIRHAKSEGNRRMLIQGQMDFPLTEEGRVQAQRLGERFKDETIDRIYVSDLTRAVQTAEPIIVNHPQVAVTYDERLRERHYGAFENRPKREIIALGEESALNTWVAPPGGEHLEAFTERVMAVLDDIYAQHQGQTVLIVSHSGVLTRIMLTLADASDEEYLRYRPRNASVSIIEFDLEKNHHVRLMSCCEHIEGKKN